MLVIPAFRHRFIGRIWRKPVSDSLPTAAVAGTVAGAAAVALPDLCRSKGELLVENALLRQQLIVLPRQVSRPQLTNTDRALLVLLAGRLRSWKSGLLVVQP